MTRQVIRMLFHQTPLLHSKNVQDAIAFYCGKLGFTLISKIPTDGEPKAIMVKRDYVTIIIKSEYATEVFVRKHIIGKEKGIGNHIYILVDDIEVVRTEFEQKGVPFLNEVSTNQEGIRQFTVSDPDGYYIDFVQSLSDN